MFTKVFHNYLEDRVTGLFIQEVMKTLTKMEIKLFFYILYCYSKLKQVNINHLKNASCICPRVYVSS
jgi:hypothetical protein